jgi:hypothetical protein
MAGHTPDVSAVLLLTENVLRDLLESVLSHALGSEWLSRAGVTNDRFTKWRARRDEEAARRRGAVVEQRLICYSDLTDLDTIIHKQWDLLKGCFDDQQQTRLDLGRLIGLRTALAHGRALLPFEEHLALGITGEIRNKVTIFMTANGPTREYFPRIEVARDSFGNATTPATQYVDTGLVLHPGDAVTFDLHAWDPDDLPVNWWACINAGALQPQFPVPIVPWTWEVQTSHIAERQLVAFFIISERPYHRRQHWDDLVWFCYRVLPIV